MKPLLSLFASIAVAAAQEPSPKAAAEERSVPGFAKSCYFLIAPDGAPKADEPAGLLVVLPGGDGSREFLPWVENAVAAQAPRGFVTALVTAVKWRDDQQIVWASVQGRAPDMQWTSEDHVLAVIQDVQKVRKVDPARILLLAWSSSGPVAYPLLCAKETPFAGGYVAMSIWPERAVKDLGAVKGRRFFLDQSSEDETTPLAQMQKAHAALTKAGAVVRASLYKGGHGWHDAPLPRLREGFRWLLSKEPAPAPQRPDGKQAQKAKPTGDNLLVNGGFEKGLDGWKTMGNSGRLRAEPDPKDRKEGKQSLHLSKTGGMPLDLVTQEVGELPKGGKFVLRAFVKSKGCKNAFVKCWLYAGEQPLSDDVDVVHLAGDSDWQKVEKTWDATGATRAVVQIVVLLEGELWIDGVELKPAK